MLEKDSLKSEGVDGLELKSVMAKNPVSGILSSVNATTIFLTSHSNIVQRMRTD